MEGHESHLNHLANVMRDIGFKAEVKKDLCNKDRFIEAYI